MQPWGDLLLRAIFSFDLLCEKTSSLPVVNDHVSVRNRPPPPYPNVATESANVISLAAAHEPALMQYILDGSTWSSICPFLDLPDFQHEKEPLQLLGILLQSTRWCTPFFLLHNAPGHRVDNDVQVDGSIWWLP